MVSTTKPKTKKSTASKPKTVSKKTVEATPKKKQIMFGRGWAKWWKIDGKPAIYVYEASKGGYSFLKNKYKVAYRGVYPDGGYTGLFSTLDKVREGAVKSATLAHVHSYKIPVDQLVEIEQYRYIPNKDGSATLVSGKDNPKIIGAVWMKDERLKMHDTAVYWISYVNPKNSSLLNDYSGKIIRKLNRPEWNMIKASGRFKGKLKEA